MDSFPLTLDGFKALASSVPAIVALVIVLVNRAKVWLVSTPLEVVPLWVVACAVSAAATACAKWAGALTGAWDQVLFDAVVLAAASSGFREWFAHGWTKPLAESSGARLAADRTAARR